METTTVMNYKSLIPASNKFIKKHEIKELIIKIMHSKYLPKKLLDRFQELTNDDADRILIVYDFLPLNIFCYICVLYFI